MNSRNAVVWQVSDTRRADYRQVPSNAIDFTDNSASGNDVNGRMESSVSLKNQFVRGKDGATIPLIRLRSG